MKNKYKHDALSIIDSASLLLKNTNNDPYLSWLFNTEFPPKSYMQHPLKSENELNKYKKIFLKNFNISLGSFIRIKRVRFILENTKHQKNDKLFYSFIETPIGKMISIVSEKGLCLLEFLDRKMLETEINELINYYQSNLIKTKTSIHVQLQKELDEYFQKKLVTFSIPLDMIGTDFQIIIWKELIKINYGNTISYSQQALNLKMPNTVRAIASANGKNKISILVPCHRVLKKNGELGGYGGGIFRKKYLIELEKN